MNMEASSSSLSALAPLVFDEENYQAWAVKMQVYMEGCDYWEAMEDDYEVAALPDNPTLNQIRYHKEMKTKKVKAKACLYVVVSPTIFSRIMACDSAKKIWDFLKAEYQGDEKIKSMKGLNLVRKFEGLQMKESETIKEYLNKLVDIANKARMLGIDLFGNRLVQKILVSLPERGMRQSLLHWRTPRTCLKSSWQNWLVLCKHLNKEVDEAKRKCRRHS